ncbi:MAG: CdaR family protein [Firmicutes bacterium]|nr:CdaR family protein [Bacillota bacterium]
MKRRSGWLESNLFVRLLSLVLGLTLWVMVNSGEGGQSANGLASTTAVLHNIPVTVYTSSKMIAVSVRPRKLNVSVSGSIIDVATVEAEASGIRAVAKAGKLGPGVHQVPVVIENVPTSAVNYTPESTTVEADLQQRITMYLAPRVQLEGAVQTGLTVGQARLSSAQVRVSGPDTLVHQVKRLELPINLEGALTDISRRVPVVAVDASGRVLTGVSIQPASVFVHLPVHGQQTTIPLQVQTSGQPAPGYAVVGVSAQPGAVLVYGPSTQLLQVHSLTLSPINVSGWKTGRTVYESVPIPFAGARISEPLVAVTVSIGQSGTVSLTHVPVQLAFENSADAYKLAGGGQVNLVISGPAQEVSTLTAEDVQAFVDVSALAVGKKTAVPVHVTLPPGCSVSNIAPKTIVVTVTPRA